MILAAMTAVAAGTAARGPSGRPRHGGTVDLRHGDCLEVMRGMDAASVDAVVTDPPYHLTSEVPHARGHQYGGPRTAEEKAVRRGFMGQTWDGGDIAFRPEMWAEALRVLKPGGHLVAFSGSRTYHRMAVAIEDAGFEIRDQLMWLYGSGFPKSLDVSKAIDKAAGAEREVVGVRPGHEDFVNRTDAHSAGARREGWDRPWKADPEKVKAHHLSTAPATDAARQWAGWGTSLKPAHEPVLLASKPLKAVPEWDSIAEVLFRLWSRLWLMLPANAAALHSQLNPSAYGVDPSASALWIAGEQFSIQADLSARMDTSQFVSALISSLSTVLSWSSTLAESWQHGSTSTTETVSSTTTDLRTLKFSLSQITPSTIILAHRSGQWSSADASTAERYLNASVAELLATRERSALASAIAASAQTFQEGAEFRPNHEPIVLARKPLIGTVAGNVLQHGVGALNIDGCRVESGETLSGGTGTKGKHEGWDRPWMHDGSKRENYRSTAGRWPANVCHDGSPQVLAAFAAFGEKTSGALAPHHNARESENGSMSGKNYAGRIKSTFGGDTGTAARFFKSAGYTQDELRFMYSGKSSAKERHAGCGDVKNDHPCVKPIALMQWLCRLVTPPGGTILDPFLGSGSTAIAASRERFNCIGIEQSAEYMKIAMLRLAGDGPLFSSTSASESPQNGDSPSTPLVSDTIGIGSLGFPDCAILNTDVE